MEFKDYLMTTINTVDFDFMNANRVPLFVQAADPPNPPSGKYYFYSKLVNGVAKPFIKSSDGTVTALYATTVNNTVYQVSDVPTITGADVGKGLVVQSGPTWGLGYAAVDLSSKLLAGSGLSWAFANGQATISLQQQQQQSSAVKVAIVNDTKAAGSSGGTFTAGSWVQRTLNTLISADSFVSLATNNVTILETGKYYLRALAPASGVNYHQVRLVKNGTELALGTVSLIGQIAGNTHSHVAWGGSLTSGDVIQLQHRCSVTYATYGLGAGIDASWGSVVFSEMEIIKYS
jgi:hypothetical protein